MPPERLAPETLTGLLEEFASRDGTDYGEQETPLDARVSSLQRQLAAGRVALVFDVDSESWDLLPADDARRLLGETS